MSHKWCEMVWCEMACVCFLSKSGTGLLSATLHRYIYIVCLLGHSVQTTWKLAIARSFLYKPLKNADVQHACKLNQVQTIQIKFEANIEKQGKQIALKDNYKITHIWHTAEPSLWSHVEIMHRVAVHPHGHPKVSELIGRIWLVHVVVQRCSEDSGA